MSKLPKSDLDCYWSNTAAQNLRARKSSARYKISPLDFPLRTLVLPSGCWKNQQTADWELSKRKIAPTKKRTDRRTEQDQKTAADILMADVGDYKCRVPSLRLRCAWTQCSCLPPVQHRVFQLWLDWSWKFLGIKMESNIVWLLTVRGSSRFWWYILIMTR